MSSLVAILTAVAALLGTLIRGARGERARSGARLGRPRRARDRRASQTASSKGVVSIDVVALALVTITAIAIVSILAMLLADGMGRIRGQQANREAQRTSAATTR